MCGKGFYLAATYSFDLVETVHEQQGGVWINEADFTKKEIALGELRVILHAMCHKCMQCPKPFFPPHYCAEANYTRVIYVILLALITHTCIHLLFIFLLHCRYLAGFVGKKAASELIKNLQELTCPVFKVGVSQIENLHCLISSDW